MQMSCIEFTQECCLFNTLQKVLQSCADQCHAITGGVFVFVLLAAALRNLRWDLHLIFLVLGFVAEFAQLLVLTV